MEISNVDYNEVAFNVEKTLKKVHGESKYNDKLKVFFFENNDNSEEFNQIFQFCQHSLNETLYKYYGIKAFFYFIDSPTINAIASPKYIIGVNKGVIENLLDKCFNNNIFLEKEELSDYKFLNDIIGDQHQKRLNFIMFLFAYEFIFYHEFAHLLQYKFKREEKGKVNQISEYNNQNSDYFEERHLMEMDSDILGSATLTLSIIQIFDLLEEKNKTQHILHQLFSVGMATVITVFRIFMKNRAFYLKKYKHPHPLIRAIYVSGNIIRGGKFHNRFEEVNDDIYNKIINDSLRISNCFFENDKEKYFDYKDEYDTQIDEYINEMKKELKKCSFLSGNHTLPFAV